MNTVSENSPFYLTMGRLSEASIADLSPHFNNLPDNEYQDGEYRLRRFGAFTWENGNVKKLPHQAFVQSSEFNKFQGDIVREYEDILPECYESEGFAEMMQHYFERSGLPENTTIEMHQLRIQAKPNETVAVAPEGVHQDGYDRIGMFMINYNNLSGGALKIHLEKDLPPMIDHLLANGEYFVLNDARFWHDADDVTCTHNSDLGYYDLFVLTGRL